MIGRTNWELDIVWKLAHPLWLVLSRALSPGITPGIGVGRCRFWRGMRINIGMNEGEKRGAKEWRMDNWDRWEKKWQIIRTKCEAH